jgi:hypothetical protein
MKLLIRQLLARDLIFRTISVRQISFRGFGKTGAAATSSLRRDRLAIHLRSGGCPAVLGTRADGNGLQTGQGTEGKAEQKQAKRYESHTISNELLFSSSVSAL